MTSFAFIGGIGFEEIILWLIYIGIYIGFFLGIFLLLRPLMLWYWKVDTMIMLMKEQKELLNDIYIQQGGRREKYSNDTAEEIARKAKLFDESQKANDK